MTEYEMANLFYQIVEVSNAALANYLTVVFAVLIVSYFAADKLDTVTWIVLISVYSIFAVGMMNEIVSAYSDLVRLGWEMARSAGDNGATLSWHGMASASNAGPQWVIPIMVGAMCVLAYLGSVFFFFRIRSRGKPKPATR